MVQPPRQWLTRIAIGLAIGAVAGVTIGWWLWPVAYTNTSPAALRDDYRDEYVLMIATAYGVEEDPEEARQRLAVLDPETPAAPVMELADRLAERGGSQEDLTRLTHLASALEATEPASTPRPQS